MKKEKFEMKTWLLKTIYLFCIKFNYISMMKMKVNEVYGVSNQ